VRHKRWAALLLVPFFLSGCSVLDTLTGSSSSSTSISGGAGASPAPSGTPWLKISQGSATPSPAASRPTGTASPTPTGGFLPLPSANPNAPTPAATCPPTTFDFSQINALSVTPGTTSATANWYNLGGYHLVQFRMTAMSQDVVLGKQRDIGWVTVTPKTPCGPVSATITGLDRKTRYVISVDAVVYRRSGDGTHAATVFRSGPFRTS
jgi:hypothetical protein